MHEQHIRVNKPTIQRQMLYLLGVIAISASAAALQKYAILLWQRYMGVSL